MYALRQDLRYAFRMLGKSPAFTAAAVVILALGIGTNAAIFSFVDALLLRPFPFRQLDRIMTVWATNPGLANAHSTSGERHPFTPADYLDLSAQSRSFATLGAYRMREFALTGASGPEWEQGVQVEPAFFDVVATKPFLGRPLLPEDMQPGHDQVVVLSHPLWKRFFLSDQNVIGKTLDLNYGRKVTVVGVMPETFDYPMAGPRLYVPLIFTDQEKTERGIHNLFVEGRLKEGVSRAQAETELQAIATRLEERYPDTNRGRGTQVVPLASIQAGYNGPLGLLFQGAAVFVLLMACANLANLLLARANSRQREIAVRGALGASRWQIVRQLMTESLVLSLLGGVLALGLAYYGVEYIRTAVPENITWFMAGWREIRLEGRAVLFTLAVTVLTTVLFGLAPALQASRMDLTETLKEGASTTTTGRTRRRLRNALVVCEVTLALVLLVGAGLMVRGTMGLTNMYRSLDPEGIVTMRVSLPADRYMNRHQMADFYQRTLEAVKRVPKVDSVSVVTNLVGSLRGLTSGGFSIEGRPPAERPVDRPAADFVTVSPDYFQSFRIPLVQGRALSETDGPDSNPVVVISETAARRFWPGQDPIGQRVSVKTAAYLREDEDRWFTVVGVSHDVKQFWIDKAPRPAIFFNYLQGPRREMSVAVRAAVGTDPLSLVNAVRKQVWSVDSQRPVYGIRTLERVIIIENLASVRLFATVMGTLAVIAVVLAAVGIYGLMVYYVSQRKHEIGIRMAVGGQRRDVLGLVLGQAMRLVGIGFGFGVPIALALGRVLTGALFGLTQFSLGSVALVAFGLAAVAALAGYLPAQRAASLDPVKALRYE